MVSVAQLVFGLVALSAAAMAGKPCCPADIVFVIDVTDGIGFSPRNCESHIRNFLKEITYKNSRRDCDDIRVGLVEYGSKARIKINFNTYSSTEELRDNIVTYKSSTDLGGTSNAKTGFVGVKKLLSEAARGHRADSPVTIFWLVHSNPSDVAALDAVVDDIKNLYPGIQIVVIAVGSGVDDSEVEPVATSINVFYHVDDIINLIKFCHKLDIHLCPYKTTTTSKTTTTTRITTTLPDVTTGILQTSTFPDSIPADDFCFEVRQKRNQKDHFADPTECHHYYQCFYLSETSAVGIRRVCPAGTFWHDVILQCMPEIGSTPCSDPCLDNPALRCHARPAGGCKAFYQCANTASYGMCCPAGTEFNLATCSCDESTTCTADCEQTGPAIPTTVAPASTFNVTVCLDSYNTYISSVPGEANAYILIDVEGNPTDKQYCPNGVEFSLDTCTCSIYNDAATAPTSTTDRRALVYLPLDTDAKDNSANKFATFLFDGAEVNSDAAAVGSGSLVLDNGFLSIPGLKTYDWQSAGSWCAFFRCEGGSGYNCGQTGGILSNNKDSTPSEYTVVIGTQATNTLTGNLHFWYTNSVQTVQASITIPANGWNHFCLTYDGNTVNFYLNGVVADTENVAGYLTIAHSPFVIGKDQARGYFRGRVDELLITDYALTAEEVNFHRTGNRQALADAGIIPN